MNLFYQPDISKGNRFLDEEESRHAVKALRLKEGDPLEVTDGKGALFNCVIKKAESKKCEFEITGHSFNLPKKYSIHLAIAPTKNIDRIEWLVEKAVEIGIDELSFLLCEKSERKNINLDRIKKLAVSAMKQSQQLWLPVIHNLMDFKNILNEASDQKFIAYVDQKNPDHLKNSATPSKRYLVLIGPEGDFSKNELEYALDHNFKKVSLGPNRLRTETAGLVACQILNLINQ